MNDEPAREVAQGAERSVAVVSCPDYRPELVRAAFSRLLEPFGGMAAFVGPGERIALKPNLLLGAPPETAVTTHPAVVEAVAAAVREAGAEPFVAESAGAGIPHTESSLRRVYARSGLEEMARRVSLPLSLDVSSRVASHPAGRLIKRLDVISPILDADGVVSLPKFKTHHFMVFSGAVKNLFGVVPGYAKPGYHAKLRTPDRFAEMLLDLLTFVQPRLSVMDGILAMEGEGPGRGGSPRTLGVLLAGPDAVTLDVACCLLAGITPARVPTLAAARRVGMWSGAEVEVLLDATAMAELRASDFRVPAKLDRLAGFGRLERLEWLLRPLLNSALNPLPRPDSQRCTGCRSCERACPTQAVQVKDRLAIVDEGTCIRCYCCHEVCPEAAVTLVRRGLGRVAGAFRSS